MAMRALNRPVIQRTEDHGTHQVIHPRNTLKAKAAVFDDNQTPIDDDAIARAEAALEDMSNEFFDWIDEAVIRLTHARDALWDTGVTEATTDGIYRAAHDIRGTGTTFGFPLASRVSESLVYLIEKIGIPRVPRLLIDKHVDSIRAIVKEDARDDDEMATTLVSRLAAVTNRFVEMQQTTEPSAAVH
jgi:chemotaxis protein histidine kinase CheA